VSRALSTVLDVTVFFLLVSAAATTLTLPTGSTPAPDATPARTVVATSTATVTYSLAPGARAASPTTTQFPRTTGPEFHRYARGTLAGLLADVAVRNVSIDGQRVTHTTDGFGRAVGAATANATGPRTHVRATWQPFLGASVVGRATGGTPPPADAQVAASTLIVDSGVTDTRARARRAANRSGFVGVADVAAAATVRLLVPADGMRLALHGDYPVDRLAAHRYRRLGRLLDANVSAAVTQERPRPANAALRDALAARYEAAFRARFDTPRAAARAVQVGRVRIVVRRWSR
jgi:hypothetical protein